jgi:hypothetical protein
VAVLDLLKPLCRTISALDLSHPDEAVAALRHAHPELSAVREAVLADDGLVPKRAGPQVRFGRVAKPSEATFGLSIDAVDMAGAAAEHTHPNGEVSLCFATEGDPRFLGHPEGWVVVPPGSRHVPTVTGGRMRILYFLPDGAMVWH